MRPATTTRCGSAAALPDRRGQSRRHAHAHRAARALRHEHDLCRRAHLRKLDRPLRHRLPLALDLPQPVGGLQSDQRRPRAHAHAIQSADHGRGQCARRSATCSRPTTRPASPARSPPSTRACCRRRRPTRCRSSPARWRRPPQSASFTMMGQFLGTIFGQTGSTRALGGAAALAGASQQARRPASTTGGGTRIALSRRGTVPGRCLRHGRDAAALHGLGAGLRLVLQHRSQRQHRQFAGRYEFGRRRHSASKAGSIPTPWSASPWAPPAPATASATF